MILKASKLFFAFLFQIVDEVNVFPRIVMLQNVRQESNSLFAELNSGVSTDEAVIFIVVSFVNKAYFVHTERLSTARRCR
jgi:hypothetical protein